MELEVPVLTLLVQAAPALVLPAQAAPNQVDPAQAPGNPGAINLRRPLQLSSLVHTAYIGLGSNLGEREETLQEALRDIAAMPDTQVMAVSDFYRTSPVDSSGPDYINAVAELATGLSPLELLRALQSIENAHGRQRPYRNAPRTLDLDVLTYDELVQDDPQLILPHPRMHQRAFVLRPLLDIAEDMQLLGKPVTEWLADCSDQGITLYKTHKA